MRSDVCIQVFTLLKEKEKRPNQVWRCVPMPHLHIYLLNFKTVKLVTLISVLGQAKGKKKSQKH